MWRFIKWLAGGVATLIMLATQVGPKEAKSRLSEWLAEFGFETMPDWLTSQAADKWAFWLGLMIVVALVGWWLLKERLARRTFASDEHKEQMPIETEEAALAAADLDVSFDVTKWGNQPNYFVWLAACLWAEIRPTNNIPADSPAYRPLQRIKADLVAGKAKSLDGLTTASARVSIQELRKIAKRAKEQPRFLSTQRRTKQSSKPEPNMHLEEVVKRLTGRDRLPLPIDPGSDDLIYACNQIREKALNDQIAVFGCAEWRATQPKDYDHMVRSRIPAEYWKSHKIDAADSFGTDQIFRRGITSRIAGGWDGTEYLWLWFDRSQVEAQWPG